MNRVSTKGGGVAPLRTGASGRVALLRKGASAGKLTWNDTAPSLSSGAVSFFFVCFCGVYVKMFVYLQYDYALGYVHSKAAL